MKRPLFCHLPIAPVVSILLFVSSQAIAQPRPEQLTVADRVLVASKIYATIQQYFAHWDGTSRSDVEAAYREYADTIVRASNRDDFDLATLRFVAKLRNAHAQFFDSRLESPPLKFRLLPIDGQWVVINSQDAQLRRGAVVRSLDGRPVEDYVRERAQYVAASNERLALTHVFSYPVLFPERVRVGLSNGDDIVIDRTTQQCGPDDGASRG